jgi:hypothetical protein
MRATILAIGRFGVGYDAVDSPRVRTPTSLSTSPAGAVDRPARPSGRRVDDRG